MHPRRVSPLHAPRTDKSVKLEHADRHIATLRGLCQEYEIRNPTPLSQVRHGRTIAYIFSEAKHVPDVISLTFGDVLHSLRSALDAYAFALVRSELGHVLTAPEGRACAFPISSDPKKVDKFFRDPARKVAFSERVKAALRPAQPFTGPRASRI